MGGRGASPAPVLDSEWEPPPVGRMVMAPSFPLNTTVVGEWLPERGKSRQSQGRGPAGRQSGSGTRAGRGGDDANYNCGC